MVPVTVAYAVADAILTMGALSSFAFLGVGVQPPTPEWGAIMYEGRAYLDSAWWITVCPGPAAGAHRLRPQPARPTDCCAVSDAS